MADHLQIIDRGGLGVAAVQDAVEADVSVPLRDPVTGLLTSAGFAAALDRILGSDESTTPVLVASIRLMRYAGLIAALEREELVALRREIGRRIRSVAGAANPVCRLASDSFVVCATDDLVPSALLAAFRDPVVIGGKLLYLPVSIGIATYPEHGADSSSLVKAAWLAAHDGRRCGESRWHLYSASLGERLTRKRGIEHALRKAIAELERGETDPFELVYQPKIDLASREVSGVEALIRWPDNEAGAGPGEFIAIAEETGLIVTLGRWIVSRSLAHYQAWRACGGEVKLAINVSPAQLASTETPRFPEFLAAELAASGVSPFALEIEITEGIMADPDARAAIDELSAMGVGIAVDDFGKFYSNLAILSSIPASTLKIDKEFVDDILGDEKKRVIAQQVVTMARMLGMRSIMEGVETAEQLDLLSSLGCDEVQGFVFSRPLRPECIPLIQSHIRIPHKLAGDLSIAISRRRYAAE